MKRQSIPAKSCLVGPGSIYALNPCTEETARKAIEEGIHRPLILLSIPERAQITASVEVDPEEICPACECMLQYCECSEPEPAL